LAGLLTYHRFEQPSRKFFNPTKVVFQSFSPSILQSSVAFIRCPNVAL